MALIEMFSGNPEVQKPALLNVLNQGLLAAEGKAGPIWSYSDDLRIQFKDGLDRPDFLDEVDPIFIAIYEEWLDENTARVQAVLGR